MSVSQALGSETIYLLSTRDYACNGFKGDLQRVNLSSVSNLDDWMLLIEED